MNKKHSVSLGLICLLSTAFASDLPQGFVYLKTIDPSILQDIRYAGYHNFMGRPIEGYEASECILTLQAANALKAVQTELQKFSLSLKVYDCYRPQMAVNNFITWSKDPKEQQMKSEFYPRVNKADFFKLGYVAEKSGHTRGSTVDLTIVFTPTPEQAKYRPGQKLVSCFSDAEKRFQDNMIDMGTGYDCLDETAHVNNQTISATAYENRQRLRTVMEKFGFIPYDNEWWHFTLKREPYPNTYFNFKVQ